MVDDLAQDVGHRLVHGAALAPVEELGVLVDDAVGHLVPDHVVGAGVGLAVEHLGAVPERVGVGAAALLHRGWAVAHRRGELLHASDVDAEPVGEVDPRDLGVGVRRRARVVEGGIDVNDPARPRSLAPVEARRAGRLGAAHIVVVTDHAVDVLDLVEVDQDAAGGVVDEHQAAYADAVTDLEPPDSLRGAEASRRRSTDPRPSGPSDLVARPVAPDARDAAPSAVARAAASETVAAGRPRSVDTVDSIELS